MPRYNVNDCKIIDLPRIQSRSGSITPVEGDANIPFKIRRVFYQYDIPSGVSRGAHAHRTCHQFLIATSGSFEVFLDDCSEKKTINLNRPFNGIYIPPGIWAQVLNYSSGAICLVLTSELFDENDYIRDYENYAKFRSSLIV